MHSKIIRHIAGAAALASGKQIAEVVLQKAHKNFAAFAAQNPLEIPSELHSMQKETTTVQNLRSRCERKMESREPYYEEVIFFRAKSGICMCTMIDSVCYNVCCTNERLYT